MESGEIDLFGLGEIVCTLDSCVEIDAVNVGVLASNGVHEFLQILAVIDVVCETVRFAAVLVDERVDTVLSTANGNDFEALTDEFLGHT